MATLPAAAPGTPNQKQQILCEQRQIPFWAIVRLPRWAYPFISLRRHGLNSDKTLSGGPISHRRKISCRERAKTAFSSLIMDFAVQPRIH
jgi:hypothetical protein